MLKRLELSKKKIKILEYRLKTRLSARPGSRKPKKGVQNAPEHESAIGTQEHHLALLECTLKVLNFTLLGFGPILFKCQKGTPFSTFSQKDASRLAFYLSLPFFFSRNLYLDAFLINIIKIKPFFRQFRSFQQQ